MNYRTASKLKAGNIVIYKHTKSQIVVDHIELVNGGTDYKGKAVIVHGQPRFPNAGYDWSSGTPVPVSIMSQWHHRDLY